MERSPTYANRAKVQNPIVIPWLHTHKQIFIECYYVPRGISGKPHTKY